MVQISILWLSHFLQLDRMAVAVTIERLLSCKSAASYIMQLNYRTCTRPFDFKRCVHDR